MGDEFSTLARVKANKGKAQWVRARYVKSETNKAERLVTHTMKVPYLMPGTIIFVHGVNTEGDWYAEAAEQLCNGLNKRLGRNDLDSGGNSGYDRSTNRFKTQDKDNKRFRRPILPFYWGYKLQPGDLQRYPGLYHNGDMAWGGGPFQNGTNSLMQFWHDGFKRKLLAGLIDLQALNPEIDRQLQDAPPRSYYVHAARRLAHLIDTIREDFPSEPVNVVAHSQGSMIALCAMLYLKNRAPDTLILNSAPYSFDTKIADWLSAAGGWAQVQSADARFNTFRSIADKIAQAKTEFRNNETNAACGYEGVEGYVLVHVRHDAERADWHGQIGRAKVNAQGQQWNECAHAGRDNRGKVFVNFNPHDRVIGVSAVQGIGWRGIPERLLGENTNRLPNVYQRAFVRNSGSAAGVPAVGEKQNYWFSYFNEKPVLADIATDSGGTLTTSDGTLVQTKNNTLQTFDGQPAYEFWAPPPNKALGTIAVQSTPGERERVWINAPTVPNPALIAQDFDQKLIEFSGRQDGRENEEQQNDFADFSRFYVPETVTEHGPDGQTATRTETPDEVSARLASYSKQQVPQTDHSQILRYGSEKHQSYPVAQVLSYDLTIGQGYAYGDADYWQYLLDLADWKVSDPYYKTGKLPDPGGFPAGLDTQTVSSNGSGPRSADAWGGE